MCGLQDINPVTNMFNSRSMLTNLWQFDWETSARNLSLSISSTKCEIYTKAAIRSLKLDGREQNC